MVGVRPRFDLEVVVRVRGADRETCDVGGRTSDPAEEGDMATVLTS
jgi:hypothetical protein